MRVGVLAVVALLLAGCAESSGPTGDGDDFSEELDQELQATATTGVIRGVVVDKAVVPVANVTVTIQGTGDQTQSNAQGAFGFTGLDPGTYFLSASKVGFNGTQTSVEVVAGIDRPDIVKMLIQADPTSTPYVAAAQHSGFLACGVAVVATSVGCTTMGALADATNSEAIWTHEFDGPALQHTQGEMVWEQTQPAGGQFIWEMVGADWPSSPQPHMGYRETGTSPALAYMNATHVAEHFEWIMEHGVDYRFFGGPHPMCTGVGFGCGVTLDQSTDVFIHHFYNFSPQPGWRFTADGAPDIPS